MVLLLVLLALSWVFHVLLGLEAVFVGDVCDRVHESVGGRVLVRALDLDGLVVLRDLLERTLLLAGRAVAGLKSGER